MGDAARRRRPARRAGGTRRRRRRPRLGSGGRIALALVAGLALVIGVGAAVGAAGGDDGAPDRVEVAGVDVSGLSADKVERAVRYRAQQLMSEPVVIVADGNRALRVEASRASLGARPRIARAVAHALEPRSVGGRVLARLGLAPTRHVALDFSLDQRSVSRLVERVVARINTQPVPARLKVTDDDIVVVPGKGGFGIDPGELRARILELPSDPIEVSAGPLPPPVSESAAAAARQTALRIVAKPVRVSLQGRGVPIEPQVLRSALRFVAAPPALRVTLDPDVLHGAIASAYSTREQPARDATFRVTGRSVRLIPSRIGRTLDMRAIAAAIVASPDATSVRARFTISRPARTAAQAGAMRITELVSEFSTPYNCCEPRVTNIKRAAGILDGMIIPAGGTFSLNQALGPRTLDRGFVSAPQIAAGRLEDAVGGGVSQVATTTYNAAFFAGIKLVAHTPHQFYISRYPEGREATVSYGGPELIFVNDWPAAILISAIATDNGITIRFFSSRLGRRVETQTGPRRDPVAPRVRETVNPDLKPGERVVQQQMGGGGFTVDYTRKVYEGTKLRRDERFTWTYSPQDSFVEVGPPTAKRPGRDTPGRTSPDRNGAPGGPATTSPGATTGGGSPRAPATTTSGGSAPPPP